MADGYRFIVDNATAALLDGISSPDVGVYYWEDGGLKYTNKKLLLFINSLGLYQVDSDQILSTLTSLPENLSRLAIQEEPIVPSKAQLKFIEVTDDVSTTAGEQINETVTLLQQEITPNEIDNKLEILFSGSAIVDNTSDRVIVFHLFINNQFIRAARIFSDRGSSERSGSCALNYVYTIPSLDPIDVEIRWGLNGSGTARIEVTTNPEYNHASLIIKEVRA